MIPAVFLFIFFFTLNSKSFSNQKIIDHLNNINSLEFSFNQLINEKYEKGTCLLEFPGKLKCNYFDEKEKEVNGEIKTIISFNGKLQRMMDVYGPGPDYIQLHTAIDDTRQLITAFFNMYSHVKEIITTSDEVASLSSNINVSRAQRELGIKDIKNPTFESKKLKGLDSLLSIAQMPKGIPVGTLAIGEDGAINAALLAAEIMAITNSSIKNSLKNWRSKQTKSVKRAPK